MNLQRRDFLRSAALTAGAGVFTKDGLAGIFAPPAAGPSAVSFDARSLIVHGRRELLISGEMHYSRSTRAMWPGILDRSKKLGLNCIASYVFWGVHEPQRGVFDFAGENDLGHFLRLCGERQLSVFLRTGPYCCAEWNFGGFPAWLRDEKGITFRTMNRPYLDRVEIYFKRLAEVIRPHLASNGGPVILVQVENEYANIAKRYGEPGQEYLRWIVELAGRVGLTSVPTTQCEGGASGAIETVNGATISDARVAEMWTRHPNAPVIWTEDYPSWYQIWGANPPAPRVPQEMASAILSFIAAGGSGWNYYMWHGGTNFGRNSMYLQTTTYNFNAPLDEYGRESRLGLYLARLHAALLSRKTVLLEGERSRTTTPSGIVTTSWKLGGEVVVVHLNPTKHAAELDGKSLPAGGAQLLAGGATVFDTEADLKQVRPVQPAWTTVASGMKWTSYPETMPAHLSDTAVSSAEPVEQLLLTRDNTDYCWYSTTITSKSDTPQDLVIPYGGDFIYVFVDGKLAAKSEGPFYENRGPIVASSAEYPLVVVSRHDEEHADGYKHRFSLGAMPEGEHRLDLLCVALGMIKGDWQIAYPMNLERKGIWSGVLLNGVPLHGWQMRTHLVGELKGMPDVSKVQWTPAGAGGPAAGKPLVWHKAEFPLSADALAEDADYRINTTGMGKGFLFVNGRAVGRYWLIEGGTTGSPSQREYHVPRNWLSSRNAVLVFEEQGSSPAQLTLERRVAIHTANS